MGGTLAKSGAARLAAIEWSSAVRDFRVAEEFIGTRLGLGDIEFEFKMPLRGPFPYSQTIDRLLIPAHLLRGAMADAEAVDIEMRDDGFTFRLEDRVFRYDRHGLGEG
jgi:hypothetical protein